MTIKKNSTGLDSLERLLLLIPLSVDDRCDLHHFLNLNKILYNYKYSWKEKLFKRIYVGKTFYSFR